MKEKTTEFERLKLGWDSKTDEITGTYKKQLADDKEKALTVKDSIHLYNSFFYLFKGTIKFTRKNGKRSSRT